VRVWHRLDDRHEITRQASTRVAGLASEGATPVLQRRRETDPSPVLDGCPVRSRAGARSRPSASKPPARRRGYVRAGWSLSAPARAARRGSHLRRVRSAPRARRCRHWSVGTARRQGSPAGRAPCSRRTAARSRAAQASGAFSPHLILAQVRATSAFAFSGTRKPWEYRNRSASGAAGRERARRPRACYRCRHLGYPERSMTAVSGRSPQLSSSQCSPCVTRWPSTVVPTDSHTDRRPAPRSLALLRHDRLRPPRTLLHHPVRGAPPCASRWAARSSVGVVPCTQLIRRRRFTAATASKSAAPWHTRRRVEPLRLDGRRLPRRERGAVDLAARDRTERQSPMALRYSRLRRALSFGLSVPVSTSCSTTIQPS